MYSDTMRRTQMVAQRINSIAVWVSYGACHWNVFLLWIRQIFARVTWEGWHMSLWKKTASDKRSIACTLFRGGQNCITGRRRKWRGYNQFSFSHTRWNQF